MSDFQPPPTWALPVDVDQQTGRASFNPVWLKWFVDLAQIINDAGGLALNHNSLAGLQGGIADQYYHLTAAEHAVVAGGYLVLKITYTDETLTIPTNTQVTGSTDLTFSGAGGLVLEGTATLAIL